MTTIGNNIWKFFDFSVEWVGFNIDFTEFKKIFSFNLDKKSITINTENCENITTNDIVYQWSTSWQSGSIPNWILDYIPSQTEYDDIYSKHCSNGPYIFSSKYLQYNCAENVRAPWTWYIIYRKKILKKKFAYIWDYSQNIIIFDTSSIQNMNVLPINFILFWYNVSAGLNWFFQKIFYYVFELIWIPINMLNTVSSIYNIIWVDFQDNTTYCFAGTKIKIRSSMLSGTMLDNVVDFTNDNAGIIWFWTQKTSTWDTVFLLCLVITSYTSYRRIKKLF